MLGLEKGIVRLVPHAEEWHELFIREEARLRAAVGGFVVAIEHIGSTSVCGVSAKPILDLAVAISGPADGVKCVAPLEKLGYVYRAENGIAGRFYFVKGAPRRTHHLHVLPADGEDFRNHLFFRDHLCRNPADAAEYDRLKKELAARHSHDRDAYLDGKADFIRKILKIAR